MTLRILIADDEPLALTRLQTLIEDIEGVEIVGTAQDGEEAAARIEALKPDLALLDIRMPNQSGLSLARVLEADPDIEVVFVTAYDHFAAQAFEVNAVDYLLKPVEKSRLVMAIERARRRRKPGGARDVAPVALSPAGTMELPNSTSEGFWVPGRDGLYRVDLMSIDWIEAARDYVILHTSTRSHILRSTMDALQAQMDPDMMIRISRSAFVRKNAVVAVNRQGRGAYVVELGDTTAVRVGATYARAAEDLAASMSVATSS